MHSLRNNRRRRAHPKLVVLLVAARAGRRHGRHGPRVRSLLDVCRVEARDVAVVGELRERKREQT